MSEVYLGNPQLKRTNVPIQFTQEQIDEYIKCSESPEYFAEHYIKIVNVDRGLVPFDMYDYQRDMIKKFDKNRFVITKMPRQSGKSTTVTAFILWRILFYDNQNVAILANKGRLAMDLLEKIKLAYENLPKWLQQGVVTWNKGNIEIENGSKVVSAATSSSAIRGGSYNLIFLDEFAFVPRNIAENFFASVYPTISSGQSTQIIIVSTPSGMNHYYKMWIDALENRSSYVPVEVHWRQIPGRDDAWRDETIRNTSEDQFRQEFECEFIGSSNTLISPIKLRELAFTTPSKDKWGLDIYEEPQINHSYLIPVDTAHGVGQDYSVFPIIDISVMPYKMVAKYRDNTISPMLFPEMIDRYGRWYNNAYVLPETNDIGQMVAEALHQDLEYENIITSIMKGRAGQRANFGFASRSNFGVRMTKQVKRIGCSNFKDLIEGDKLIINDFETIEEMSTFVARLQSYEAEDGYHDDLVMCLVMFSWFIRQPAFKQLTSMDVRNKLSEERYGDMMDDLMPAGFIDDGVEEPESIDNIRTDTGFWNNKF